MFLCLRLLLSSDQSCITCIYLHHFASIQQLYWSHSPFSRLGLKCRVFFWRLLSVAILKWKHVSWGRRSGDLAACPPCLLLRSWMCSARRFWDIILTCQNRFLHLPSFLYELPGRCETFGCDFRSGTKRAWSGRISFVAKSFKTSLGRSTPRCNIPRTCRLWRCWSY